MCLLLLLLFLFSARCQPPFVVIPPRPGVAPPCFRDINVTERRLAIYFAGAQPFVDLEVLRGVPVEYFLNGSSVIFSPSFGQQLQFNCTPSTAPIPPVGAVNATYTCVEWYRDNPVATRVVSIPLECLTEAYIFPVQFNVGRDPAPTPASLCLNVSSPVTGSCSTVVGNRQTLTSYCQCFFFRSFPPTQAPLTPTSAPTALTNPPTTQRPTATPTRAPSRDPTRAPTGPPVVVPTSPPVRFPTAAPSSIPSTPTFTNTPTVPSFFPDPPIFIPPPTPTSSPTNAASTGLSTGEIVAIVLVGLLVAVILCLFLGTIVIRNRNQTISMYRRD